MNFSFFCEGGGGGGGKIVSSKSRYILPAILYNDINSYKLGTSIHQKYLDLEVTLNFFLNHFYLVLPITAKVKVKTELKELKLVPLKDYQGKGSGEDGNTLQTLLKAIELKTGQKEEGVSVRLMPYSHLVFCFEQHQKKTQTRFCRSMQTQ